MNDLPPLAQEQAHLETRNGIKIHVRPARETDAPALTTFFEQVSDEDRRFRFLSSAQRIGAKQLEPFLNTDHDRTQSWLAFDAANDRLIASGMLVCDAALKNAEVAISICSDYRGQGVGWSMLDYLAQEARDRGCRRVFSIESRDNHAAIALEREKGFTAEACDDDPTLIMLTRSFT